MSGLIREARRNAKNWADKPESAAMWNRFADELERLTAERDDFVARANRGAELATLAADEIERLTAVLQDIANEDFRGNRSTGSQKAFKALKEGNYEST